MIRVENLFYAYPHGDFALDLPSLTVAEGEKLAVVGASGCGKSTLLNLIAGVLTPGRGSITIGDHRITALSDRRRRAFRASSIGFVFQDFGLLDYLSAEDNALHPYRISSTLKLTDAVREQLGELADKLGVADKLGARPGALSHGERQRVAICRALLPSPNVILADEATGNLDPANKRAILDLLFDAAGETGAPLIAVTHDHDLLPMFDRTVDFRELSAAS